MRSTIYLYTIDLDSTMYDTSHRAHMISQDPDPEVRNRETDWDAHALACVDDTLVVPAAVLAHSFRRIPNAQVHFVSGRSEAAFTATLERMREDGIDVVAPCLHMAPSRAQNPDFWNRVTQSEYKIQRIQDVVEHVQDLYPDRDVVHVLHVDDHSQISADLNDAGICTLSVRTPYEIPAPSHLSGKCDKHGPYLYFCGPCQETWAEENPERLKKVQAEVRRCLPKSLGGTQPDLEETPS